jgi:hypothetical protein
VTPEDQDVMLDLCRRIYRENDPIRLPRLIGELLQIIQRKIDSLKNKPDEIG